MSTKLAKAKQSSYAARQSARDAKASTKPLKAENRKLRNALIKIAETYAGEEPGRIAQEALGHATNAADDLAEDTASNP